MDQYVYWTRKVTTVSIFLSHQSDIRAMASSSIIQPTAFPRLDILCSPLQRESNSQKAYKRLAFSFTTAQDAHPKGRDDLLKSYSQFIASYTGQSEITFQYVLRTQLYKPVEPQIFQSRTYDEQAISDSDRTHDYVLDLVHHIQQQTQTTTTFDFGLEIVADVDHFLSAEAPALLSCVSIICIMMDENHNSNTNSLSWFNTMPWKWL